MINTEINSDTTQVEQTSSFAPVVIIGSGPVGVRAARALLDGGCEQVVIFGEEKISPYNRVQLSLFLAGEVPEEELSNPVNIGDNTRFIQHLGRLVISVDTEEHTITDNKGLIQPYSKLILATGSKPFLPPIPGHQKEGVHTFRTIEDTHQFLHYKAEHKNVFIAGSGALGLETAIAMKTPENKVYLGVRDFLLTSDLDEKAYEILGDYFINSGIQLVMFDPIVQIMGEKSVRLLKLASGKELDCDVVIFCAGVRPNVELGRHIGLEINRGIVVDDHMQSSIPDIYAIGECAEHNESVHGIVAPGYEQAKVSSKHILGLNLDRTFEGSYSDIKLKFGNYDAGFYGNIEDPNAASFTYYDKEKAIYRKVFMNDHRIVGMVHMGEWAEVTKIKTYISQAHQHFDSLDLVEGFKSTGFLWGENDDFNIHKQPDDYIVCVCENVNLGTLRRAVDNGNKTVEALGAVTKAGTVCGSCKPILGQLVGTKIAAVIMRYHKPLYSVSIIAIIAALITFFLNPLSMPTTAKVEWHIATLWIDNFWKQVSGFSLLALSIFATLLSLRKRWSNFKLGHLDLWRYAHAIIGTLALVVLVVHTGFRMGNNLNFALMLAFITVTLSGSAIGIVMSKNYRWGDLKLQQYRKWYSWVHNAFLWSLPALLAFHIITTYYF